MSSKLKIDKINIEEGKLYRGSIPFFLMNKNKKTIYISSSNKNITDYYFSVKDFLDNNVMKIENNNFSEEEFRGKNIELIKNLTIDDKSIVFLSLSSIFKEYFVDIDVKKFEVENEYSRNEIEDFLTDFGFERNYIIEKRGEFSIRGDIIDIYPVGEKNPVRLEFFDDYLEEIRYFDIDTQKSIDKIKKIDIQSKIGSDESKSLIEFIEYFEKNNDIEIIIENKELLDYKLEELILFDRDNEKNLREKYSRFISKTREIEIKRFASEDIEKYKDYELIKKISHSKELILFTEEKKRYEEIFQGYPIFFDRIPHYEGFETKHQLVLTDRELKGIKVKRVEKRKDALKLKSVNQIRQGDYVIHENHGVGLFLGIEVINDKDYIAIKYADADKLYVPVDGINRIEKYISEPGLVPPIYNLGTKGFRRKREKLRKEIEEFAKELIKIQAKRQASTGFSYSKDTVWQEEFEEGFPYNETPDQLKAINEVKRDMESYKVMDRIVCGDVGYGKTEVALRAAFKAVMDGKQVAVLTPTTILANQHYDRFVDRFSNFPIEIEILSRLDTKKEQTELVKSLKNGGIDIVIGTHRLLSNDVNFKDVGLIIIDEEQKFGVKAKEKLKTLRNNLDILTLTATPIPRTLNFALLGIRDISIIETPPENRIPVETEIIDKSDEIIKDKILKEISREGQVFYLYNSVKNMENKIKELRKILPDYINIDFINGKMPAKLVKEKITNFENGEFDVLLTTTIIENGIDIENANTILIEGIHKLGLSQIYQLRGRVGRSARKAYCYLLLETERKLSKKTKLRKDSLMTVDEMGGGFQLSLEDMKIRGAGEILGDKQHGAIETFGYDLYLKMLNEEIKVQKDEMPTPDVYMDINKKSYIPSDYIKEVEKVIIYKRILSIEKLENLLKLENEIVDRFGKMPGEMKELLEYYRIKLYASSIGIVEIKETKDGYLMKVNENKIEIDKLNMLILNGRLTYIFKEKSVLLKAGLLEFLIEFKEMLDKTDK